MPRGHIESAPGGSPRCRAYSGGGCEGVAPSAVVRLEVRVRRTPRGCDRTTGLRRTVSEVVDVLPGLNGSHQVFVGQGVGVTTAQAAKRLRISQPTLNRLESA